MDERLEAWQIPEITDADRIEDRRSGEDRRLYSPISQLNRHIQELEGSLRDAENAALYYQREYHEAIDRWAMTGIVAFVLGVTIGMVGLTIARMLW